MMIVALKEVTLMREIKKTVNLTKCKERDILGKILSGLSFANLTGLRRPYHSAPL